MRQSTPSIKKVLVSQIFHSIQNKTGCTFKFGPLNSPQFKITKTVLSHLSIYPEYWEERYCVICLTKRRNAVLQVSATLRKVFHLIC